MKRSKHRKAVALQEMVRIGMWRDSLDTAEKYLTEPDGDYTTFCTALDAILSLDEDVGHWLPMVEAAYMSLPENTARKTRYPMLMIYVYAQEYEKARRFIPKRFNTSAGLMELYFAWRVMQGLGEHDELARLARLLPDAIENALDPMMKALLQMCLAEHYMDYGLWDRAIECCEAASSEDTSNKDAITTIVEIRVVQALKVIRDGLEQVETFKKKFDPARELSVPGNDAKMHEDARTEFLRLQKILEAIVPKERQREMGLCSH